VPALICHHLTFGWPTGEVVFADLDVAFPDGLTGLVGRNGVGKSTLLRILAGDLTPTAGHVTGPATIGYLPQQLPLQSERTVAAVLGIDDKLAARQRIIGGDGRPEDLDLIADDWDLEERTEAALAEFGFAGLDLDRLVGTLSGGEVILLALARLFLARPDVLILDEPTNNLDRHARERLYAALGGWRGPVITVSHERELATEQQAAARDVRAAQSDLKRQQRELADARVKLDRRVRYARSQADNVPKIVAGAKKRAAQVSAGKLRGGHEADVEQARGNVDAAEERLRDDDLIRIDLASTSVPPGRDVLVMDQVILRTGREVTLHIRGPERLALTGPNGSGKTTLIDTICGTAAPRSGRVGLRVPFRLLPQRLDLLVDSETTLAAVSRHAPSADDNRLRAQLARFLLDADAIGRPVGSLSGGERFRATLAALLLAEPAPQLLILDEPTNNLDLDSVAQLVSALRQYRGALLVASHDERFLAEIALTGRLDLEDAPVTE
jgi:ATPase subunit of ABC transporter with duplicated ATPase domains